MAFSPRRLMRGASGAGGQYQIARSLRFNSADSTSLTRTPANQGNRRTFTFSTWLKRAKLDSGNGIFTTVNGAAFTYLSFGSTNTGDWLQFAYYDGGSDPFNVNTSSGGSLFRDVSAWYHIVLAVDTTQATASNRVKIYVNNIQLTLGGTQPTLNYDIPINTTISHVIGGGVGSYTGYLSNQYLTEINFVDGQQLTPSSFGATSTTTGVWSPIQYTGSYGTNGFYLNFSDNSNITAATLGKDYSGNGNNWTPNNFSVTAGIGNDSFVDTPTPYGIDTGVGGTVRGNYCTLNPLFVPKTGGSRATLTNGNLDAQCGGARVAFGTMQIPSTGKWYFEYTCNYFSFASYGIGTESAIGGGYTDAMFGFYQNGSNLQFNIGNNSNTGTSSGIVSQAGDIALVCVDMDNGKIWMGRDRSGVVTWSGGGTPAVSSPTWSAPGQGGVWSTNFDTTSGWFPLVSSGDNDTWSCNFGQRPFAYTAPTGFKALCTTNLPTPTIGGQFGNRASNYFNPVLYTGTGSARSITGVGFQPDWVWVKSRSLGGGYNVLFDIVRGANKRLITSLTIPEDTGDGYGVVSAFDSDGFSLDSGGQNVNQNSQTYVAWNWKAGSSTVTNTAGSISAQVRANPTAGFSIVTYTSTTGTVGHGLGVAPSMIIMKGRNVTDQWTVGHASLNGGSSPWNYGLALNASSTQDTSSAFWNNTAPTSTVFSQGSWDDGYTKVAYCFAPVAGYSAFGSYAGNNSTDGPFVYTGFRPAFVILKTYTGETQVWIIVDSKRFAYNVVSGELYASTADAETTGQTRLDFVSNGFKLRTTDTAFNGASPRAYIYMAFAENPFKYSLAR